MPEATVLSLAHTILDDFFFHLSLFNLPKLRVSIIHCSSSIVPNIQLDMQGNAPFHL